MLPVKNYVSVQVNGEEIAKGLLGEVEVVQRLNDHWYCKVCYRSPLDDRPEIEKLQRAPVRISLIRLDGSEDVVFAGMVIDAQLQYETTGSYTVEVKAASPDWDMSRSKQKRYFLKSSPQDITSELVGMYGIALAGNVDGDSNLSRVQWDESDYAFLLRLVDDNEAWLRPTEGGLETQTAFQQGVTLEWREGEHGLLEFATKGQLQSLSSCGTQYDPDKTASQTFKDVTSQASFYSDSSADMVSRAASLKLLPAELVERCRVATIDDYEQRLKREARRGAVHAVVCRGISRDPQVKAGNEITVAGLSGSQGTYGVVQAIHRWTAKGYENEFVATPAKRWFQAEAAVAPNIRGVFPARVVENYDPHNQGRIQVQYWWQEDSSTTWARLMMPHAGADRGMLFFPEKGDQVMISFEDGDPERPVVVGSSYNGVHRPASEGYWNPGEKNGSEFAKNNIKRIVTKSGHRITLSDEQGRESINFATPRSTRLVMTEKANETGRPALAMHSAGDILLSAPNGRVHVHSSLHSAQVGAASAASPVKHVSAQTSVPAPATLPAPVSNAPKLKESDYDGVLVGNGCIPLTQKLKPGERLTDQQIKNAWNSAYVSNSPCCQARRAAGQAPKRIVYVNGIKTEKAGQCETLKRIANQTCAQVIGVHNSTDGFFSDLKQSHEDKNLIEKARVGKPFSTHDGRNPAVDSMSDVIANSVRDGNPPEIWAHSQGGAIASLASYDAHNQLKQSGYSQGINGVRVDSFAAAAQSWPSGLVGQHFIQAQDETPIQFGLGLDSKSDAANTGPKQSVVRFTGTSPNIQIPTPEQFQAEYEASKTGRGVHSGWERSWTDYHDMNSIYLPAQRMKDGGCSPDGK